MQLTKLIIILIALILGCGEIVLLLSKKYTELLTPLDDKEFPLKDLYGLGFGLMSIFRIDFKTNTENSLRERIRILHGEKFAEYYLRVYCAQRLTFTALTFLGCAILAALASGNDGIFIFIIGFLVSGAVYYYYFTSAETKMKKNSMVYLRDFPNAISTIALLVNSGMVLRDAWTQVAESDDKPLYLQMRKVKEDMNNGISEIDALYTFSLRCATPEIKKFTSFIIQGIERTQKDLAASLRSQSAELWEIKRQTTIQQGQLASSKLLIPIFVMFVGILVMIMGPIMTNLAV